MDDEIMTAPEDIPLCPCQKQRRAWWDEERGFPEVLALIHSEVSEALEEYRSGHEATEIYYGDKRNLSAICGAADAGIIRRPEG